MSCSNIPKGLFAFLVRFKGAMFDETDNEIVSRESETKTLLIQSGRQFILAQRAAGDTVRVNMEVGHGPSPKTSPSLLPVPPSYASARDASGRAVLCMVRATRQAMADASRPAFR